MIATTRQDEIKWFAEYPAQKCHVSLIALWMFRLDSFHYIGRMPLSGFSVCLFSLIPLSKALENIMCRSGEMFMGFFRLRVQKWKQSRCVFQIQFYLWLFFPLENTLFKCRVTENPYYFSLPFHPMQIIINEMPMNIIRPVFVYISYSR